MATESQIDFEVGDFINVVIPEDDDDDMQGLVMDILPQSEALVKYPFDNLNDFDEGMICLMLHDGANWWFHVAYHEVEIISRARDAAG